MADETRTITLEVVTPHGAPVLGAVARLLGPKRGVDWVFTSDGRFFFDLSDLGRFELEIAVREGPCWIHHEPLVTTLDVSLAGGALAFLPASPRVEQTGAASLRATLDYRFFTPIGTPPTVGNDVTVLIDGQEAFEAVYCAMNEARSSVRITTWRYEPETLLLRPEPLGAQEATSAIQLVLAKKAREGVLVQLLLWDWPLLSLPRGALEAAQASADHFEVMQEQNPTRRPLFREQLGLYNLILGRFQIGSYHQKTVVTDHTIGFCGGMNFAQNDWDTQDHAVFEPGRTPASQSFPFRRSVAAGFALPDYPPRHDLMARVTGPAVAHLEDNFRERWNRLIDTNASYADRATPVTDTPAPHSAGTSQVQVVRTMPEPFEERGILDCYLRAIRSARRLIYIEDQYFRSTRMADAITKAIRENPTLELVVLASEPQANSWVSAGWSRETFDRIRAQRPDFEPATLRVSALDGSGTRLLRDVEMHAKMLLVDDVFFSIGSCNMNDRGFEYEGEINVAVVNETLARGLRERLWREHLNDDPRLGQGIASDMVVWREHIAANRAYRATSGAEPRSRVFPFVPRRRLGPFSARGVF